MKSVYQFDSAQEINADIIEAIKVAFKDRPIQISIETLPSDEKNFKSDSSSHKGRLNTEIAESVIDLIIDQFSQKTSKPNKS